jgi:ADP-heptose:LPS heptosyltransferase
MSGIYLNKQTILISRTDSIGDVCLTLPICAALKQKFPSARIVFLGKSYTQAIIESCPAVNEFLNWDAWNKLSDDALIHAFREANLDAIVHVFPNKRIAKAAWKAKIPQRIGTSHRLFHWFSCNQLVNFTRKRSPLHEAQLNFELLKPFDIPVPAFEALKSMNLLHAEGELPDFLKNKLRSSKTVILHPKSQGSAVEWGIDNFLKLAQELLNLDYQVIFTGTESEGLQFRERLPEHPHLIDTTGRLTLQELIVLIANCEALVAASTGPLHMAGLLDKKAIGLFSPRRPIHPGRWMPLGTKSQALVHDENCLKCSKGELCKCIEEIGVGRVVEVLSE